MVAIWGLGTAVALNRGYQDQWVLDGILLPVLALIVSYIVNVTISTNIQFVTLLSSMLAFLLSIIPELKYITTYSSTIDNAAHVSMARTIATSGHVENISSYAYTPGFHAITGVMAQISGLDTMTMIKIMACGLGGIFPLAFYTLCKHLEFPYNLSRLIIILSGISLPSVGYVLEGTSFTMSITLCLTTVFFLRDSYRLKPSEKMSYNFLLLLLTGTVILWHPSSSILNTLILVLAGFVLKFDMQGRIFNQRASHLAFLGFLLIITAITYWMYSANFVWNSFVFNAYTAIAPVLVATNEPMTPALIPQRFFEIGIMDKLLILAFYHAHDLVVFGLAGMSLLFLARSIRTKDLMLRSLRTYSILFLVSSVLVSTLFLISFGSQGYRRFLSYAITFSSIPSGYMLWRVTSIMQIYDQRLISKLKLSGILSVLFFISAIQLYPYQPLTPAYTSDPTDKSKTPIMWFHDTNSMYQYYMLKFAMDHQLASAQMLVDGVGYRQNALFFGIESTEYLRRLHFYKKAPAFVLLHWPGEAGIYTEKAEYRTLSEIKKWRNRSSVSTIYDNGKSFIIYFPENPQYLEELGTWQ